MESPDASSELPPWGRKLLLAFFLFGVIPFAIYGIYTQVILGSRIEPAIQDKLLTPYAEALAKGEFDRALAGFTSEKFRERIAPEVYRAGQAKNRKTIGAPKALELQGCDEVKEPGRPWFITCKVRYLGEKREEPVSFDIVKQDGRYLIDQTFVRDPGRDTRSEQIF